MHFWRHQTCCEYKLHKCDLHKKVKIKGWCDRKEYVTEISGGGSGCGEPPASRAPQRPAAGNPVFGNTWGRGNQLGR